MIKHHVFYASSTLTMVELLKNGFNQNIFYVSFSNNWSFCSYHFSCDSSFQLQLVKSSWNAVKGWICGQGVAVVDLQVKPPPTPNPLSSSSVTPHRVQSPSIFPLLPLLYTDVAYISNTRGSCPAGLSLCSPAQLLSERTGGLWGEMGGRGFFQFLVFHIWTIIDETKQMVAEYTQQNPGREFTKLSLSGI